MALKVDMFAGELMDGYEPNITCAAPTELTTPQARAFALIYIAALFAGPYICKGSNKT